MGRKEGRNILKDLCAGLETGLAVLKEKREELSKIYDARKKYQRLPPHNDPMEEALAAASSYWSYEISQDPSYVTDFSLLLRDKCYLDKLTSDDFFSNRSLELSSFTGRYLNELIKRYEGREILVYAREKDRNLLTRSIGLMDIGDDNDINDIVVEGDVLRAGHGMRGGSLYINGNVMHDVGINMRGGSITVNGDVGEAGRSMQAGVIIIEGRAIRFTGKGMLGGLIKVNGNRKPRLASTIKGGLVVHQNKIIYRS